MGKLLAMTAVAALTIGVALASPDSDGIRAFGLDGHWAVDCAKPASRDNPHQTIVLSDDGYPIRQLDFGNNVGGVAELRDVQSIGTDRLAVLFVTQSSVAKVILVKDGNWFKSLESTSGGQTFISNGRFTASGLEAPWFEKCIS